MKLWIDAAISRGPIKGPHRNEIGMRLTLKAAPEVEAFMKTLSNGKTIGANAYDESWLSQAGLESPAVYVIDKPLSTPQYYMEHVGGQPMIARPGAGRAPAVRADGTIAAPSPEIPNLSFLKLVGISTEDGVTIGVTGIYSKDYINIFKNAFLLEAKRFLEENLVPINVYLSILSKE